jgi:hypothetical protein
MPSPADRLRLERVLRVISAVALAWPVVGAFLPGRKGGGEIIPSANLVEQLEHWTVRPPADSLGLRLAGVPDRLTRAYLRALRANGTAIAWENQGISPLMLDGEVVQDPAGGSLVRMTGEYASPVVVRDSLGLLDSIRLESPGVTVRLPSVAGTITARAGPTAATLALPSPDSVRSIVVIGMGGWESKFTIEALEERGWRVESRIGLAPRLSTGQGRPFPLDTARQVAVVALDSSAATYSREILEFVRSGGGLVLGAGATPSQLRMIPAGATELETRSGTTTLAAWRVGSGRVIQSRHRDTWRRRMTGGDNAVAEHRAWWAGLVAGVAYRPGLPRDQAVDPAPLASLVQDLGPAGRLPSESRSPSFWPLAVTLLLGALFAEWLSRRLRGAA